MNTERSPAENRGDIQSGTTGDKTPGFDPAAAPQETDAEAADAGTVPVPAATGTPAFANQASFANAMRPPDDERTPSPARTGPVLVIAALVVIAAVVFVGAAMLGR
ncbi:hypothetical protein [Mesorhizobium sp. B2-1-3A]|uniref:hypothetical protein n=1 Tax=Mesorhizobium sp. B2-1-3A TaxID=2589971 RepID=UPI00112B8208|nr:hypothetical protein [Mesorhizobium sp. B2-1-3A]TPM96606.1 hypothetical protein FJ977_18605 [Mesorhizobium sp. B2-1-3A]